MFTHALTDIEPYNPEAVTVQDCLDNYYLRGRTAIISNGKCAGFVEELGVNAEINRRSIEVIRGINTGFTGEKMAVKS